MKKPKKQRLLLPTNTNNLRMIISHGLIASPCGLSKYYIDLLELQNGWVPLFNNEIPCEALNHVISEDPKSLTTCILEIDITSITGSVKALKNRGLIDQKLDGNDISDDLQILFIPAPLPLNCLVSILFKNENDLKDFEIDVKSRSNVVLGNIKLKSNKVDKKLFSEKYDQVELVNSVREGEKHIWLPGGIPSCSEINYHKVYAFGGMLSLLFYYAKNGSVSNSKYDDICDIYKSNVDDEGSDGASFISEYFVNKLENDQVKSPKSKIYHQVIKTAVEAKDFKNDLLNILDNSYWDSDKAKSRAEALAEMLREYESNASKKTVSQQFEVAKSELEKMLLLLFVREDSDSLAKYKTVRFSEDEYIVFAMIFGIRDKFNRLPNWLKRYRGLQEFVSTKMAEYAHSLLENDISFNSFNPPPTVWELIDKKVSKKTIKELKIEHCIKTIMPKCDFSFSGKDGKITYSSFIEPNYKIVKDEYFNEISSMLVTDEIYNKLFNK
ncbi:MAG: hypothetical protein QM483_11215 [Desulfuromusa sp.]